MTLADCLRPLFACRMIYRSSPAVVVLGRSTTNLSNSCTCGLVRFPSPRKDTFVDSKLCSCTGDGWFLSERRGADGGVTSGSEFASRREVFSGRRKREKSPKRIACVRFKVDRTTSKRIRYGFITVKSTTLIGFNNPRKNTTLPAIRANAKITTVSQGPTASHQYTSLDRYSALKEQSKIYLISYGLELWFQQDGATCHTACATIYLLKDTFGDRLIPRFGPVNWPPRSCDLTPLDYFLWGYVKSLVYADKPRTLDHLEDNIRRVIADIRPQMLGKVIENWTSRLDYIRASRGIPMPEIIFKM
ncbi:uncharacterized protein TNCV_4137561 [Trichonephila clavipes]|nr:uncharacterized protein TNCV_4137561 [Trichonephila clavipes]